jgi:DNA modification methylase
VKPTGLIADAMKDCSQRGAIILDAFAGSGSTILAAEQIGRRAFCIEIDATYADVAVRRWQRFTGRDAVLEGTGRTFAEIAAQRSELDQSPPVRKPRTASNGGR